MSSYAKAAKSGMRFQIDESPLGFYTLRHVVGEYYEVLSNGRETGMSAMFTYKHIYIETVYEGIRFTKEIRLKDLNFVP